MSANVFSTNDNGVIPPLRLVQPIPSHVVSGAPPGGGGPDDPTLTRRVDALEDSMRDVRGILARIEQKQDEFLGEMKELRRDVTGLTTTSSDLRREAGELRKEQTDQGKTLAELKGRVGNLPTTLQLILFVIAVMAFGVGRSFFGA